MGINIINPDYRNLLAIEKSRINSMGLHENKKHNNYTKAIISIFAVAILLSTMGVPIYNGIYAMESNALPYDMGIVAATGNSATAVGHAGDIVEYELTHWGAKPSIASLASKIAGFFASVGLGYLVTSSGIMDAAGAILASGVLADSAIATILLTIVSGPVGWSILIGIAVLIVSY